MTTNDFDNQRAADDRAASRSTIRVLDSGEVGTHPPLVMLHGLGNSADFWSPATDWISRHRRVVAPDIPGFGLSRSARRGVDVAETVQLINAAIDDLGLGSWSLVGHSMGAVIALALAGTRPEGLDSVILVDGHLLTALRTIQEPCWALRHAPLVMAATWSQFAGGLTPVPALTIPWLLRNKLLRKLAFASFVADPSVLDPVTATRALRHTGGLGVLRALHQARTVDLRELARQVQVPVSLMWGSEDQLLTPDDLAGFSGLVEIRHSLQFAGLGHWPMIEDPEAFANALSEYSVEGGFSQ